MKSPQNTPLATAIAAQATRPGFKFAPDAAFYLFVGINRKRFGALVRGEAEITGREAVILGKYFGVDPLSLIEVESVKSATEKPAQAEMV